MTLAHRTPSEWSILIVEDQGIMSAFLQRWLAERADYKLAGAFKSGEAALAALDSTQPDLAIVDFNLPLMDGLQFVQMARQVHPQLRSLILTSLTDPLTLSRIRESRVEGYLEKDSDLDQLAAALDALANGKSYYSEVFNTTLARENARSESLAKILSRREQQVLAHVLAGRTSREIAELLDLSVRTVEFHRSNLMTKLDAPSLTELLTAVRKRGWTRAMPDVMPPRPPA